MYIALAPADTLGNRFLSPFPPLPPPSQHQVSHLGACGHPSEHILVSLPPPTPTPQHHVPHLGDCGHPREQILVSLLPPPPSTPQHQKPHLGACGHPREHIPPPPPTPLSTKHLALATTPSDNYELDKQLNTASGTM